MNHTLLLNAGFEPLRVVSWQRAFILVFQGKVEILEEYALSVSTVSAKFRIPAVIKLRRWVNLKRMAPVIRFSRVNVYLRDNYRCQYCYRTFPEKELTMDHVKPVVKGGKKNWENIVAACTKCNQKKGDRAPEEVGFKLLNRPVVPNWLPGNLLSVKSKTPPPSWRRYLNPKEEDSEYITT